MCLLMQISVYSIANHFYLEFHWLLVVLLTYEIRPEAQGCIFEELRVIIDGLEERIRIICPVYD